MVDPLVGEGAVVLDDPHMGNSGRSSSSEICKILLNKDKCSYSTNLFNEDKYLNELIINLRDSSEYRY
jgi:hypothetical protein